MVISIYKTWRRIRKKIYDIPANTSHSTQPKGRSEKCRKSRQIRQPSQHKPFQAYRRLRLHQWHHTPYSRNMLEGCRTARLWRNTNPSRPSIVGHSREGFMIIIRRCYEHTKSVILFARMY